MSYIDRPCIEIATAKTVRMDDIPESWTLAWSELAQHASEPAPFVEEWFLKPSIANLPAASEGRLLTIWRGSSLIGVLPVCIARRYGRIPVSHVQNWQHYHAFLGTPLVRAGSESAFWTAALTELDGAAWATSFLHLGGLVADGPVLAALREQRPADTAHRSERAFLNSSLSPQAYYEANIRKKKRKEIERLRSRLAEQGEVAFERLSCRSALANWTEDFLTLEASGWKGRAETALDNDPATARFFEQAVTGAFVAGELEMVRLSVGGATIAMLVNFITPPGSFSFKIAFDENYARFSPGVLIQLENLRILDRPDIEWMDSCAVADHSMINSIWAERREILRVTVRLKGVRRSLMFALCRALENASAAVRKRN